MPMETCETMPMETCETMPMETCETMPMETCETMPTVLLRRDQYRFRALGGTQVPGCTGTRSATDPLLPIYPLLLPRLPAARHPPVNYPCMYKIWSTCSMPYTYLTSVSCLAFVLLQNNMQHSGIRPARIICG